MYQKNHNKLERGKTKLKFGGIILACVVILWGAFSITPSVCAQEQGGHLWFTIENGEYEANHTDPWINESWVLAAEYKENETIQFNLTIENRAAESTDVYVLIAVRGNSTEDDMQAITVHGGASGMVVYTLADFDQTDFNPFYLDQVSAGSHGVYPPSGNGIWVTYPVGWMNGKESGNNVTTLTIEVALGPEPSDFFVVHFDAYALDSSGELKYWSPNGHDATLMKEEDKGKGKGRGKKARKKHREDEEDPIEEPEIPPIIDEPEIPPVVEEDPPIVDEPEIPPVVEEDPPIQDPVETEDPVLPNQEPDSEVEIELPPEDDSQWQEEEESLGELDDGGRAESKTEQGGVDVLTVAMFVALVAAVLSVALLRRRFRK